MARYWQILKKYKISLIISPFLVLIFVICETTQPWLMAKIVDEGVMPKDISVVTRTGIYMILVALVSLTVSIINVYISSRTSIRFGTDLRTSLFDKIQQLSFSNIDRFSSASLITRLTNDISRIQQVVLMTMRIFLRSPMMLVMALFYVIRINAGLAMVLLIAIPILGISVYIILKKGFPLFIKVQEKIDNLNAIVRENLINIRVVKSFVREDFETQKFSEKNVDLQDTVIKASNLIVTIFPLMQFVMNMSIIAILWVGGNKITAGELKVGELISFVNYLMQILMSLMIMSMVIMTIARATASSRRILEV
ncbi:MAG TPA: multidrug ABC transporter ATP-binding protein, partial [Dysgonomonas sp.]|nr:multidrug ABC transporter ATP-binding protein [Dysgonomonas sp.]